MPTIRVFDPAMCCSSGVCGPSIDPELARFAADVAWLQQQGVAVERFNLAQQPGAFAATPPVQAALARGTDVLPLILVDDRIAVERAGGVVQPGQQGGGRRQGLVGLGPRRVGR